MLSRVPETYQWLLAPCQANPEKEVSWETIRLSGQAALSVRCMKKLQGEELIVSKFAGTRLKMEMDKDFYNQASGSKLGWDPTWFGERFFDDKLVRAIKKWQRDRALANPQQRPTRRPS